MLAPSPPWLIGASAFLQVGAAQVAPQPPPSVVIVETGSEHHYVGEYPGPFPGAMNILDERVRILRRLSGPKYPRDLTMRYVAHQFSVPGTRLLVIAEAQGDGRRFLARWYTRLQRQGYCIPANRVAELHLETVVARARRVSIYGDESFCISG